MLNSIWQLFYLSPRSAFILGCNYTGFIFKTIPCYLNVQEEEGYIEVFYPTFLHSLWAYLWESAYLFVSFLMLFQLGYSYNIVGVKELHPFCQTDECCGKCE